MISQSLKTGWKLVKFGDVVKNANLAERDPEAAGIERVVGLEHLDPENLHIRRWNTLENGTSFTRIVRSRPDALWQTPRLPAQGGVRRV